MTASITRYGSVLDVVGVVVVLVVVVVVVVGGSVVVVVVVGGFVVVVVVVVGGFVVVVVASVVVVVVASVVVVVGCFVVVVACLVVVVSSSVTTVLRVVVGVSVGGGSNRIAGRVVEASGGRRVVSGAAVAGTAFVVPAVARGGAATTRLIVVVGCAIEAATVGASEGGDEVGARRRPESAAGVSRSDRRISCSMSFRARPVVVCSIFVVVVMSNVEDSCFGFVFSGVLLGAALPVAAFVAAAVGSAVPPGDDVAARSGNDDVGAASSAAIAGVSRSDCLSVGPALGTVSAFRAGSSSAIMSLTKGLVACVVVRRVVSLGVAVGATTSPRTSTFGVERNKTLGRITNSTANAISRRIPRSRRRSVRNSFTSEA